MPTAAENFGAFGERVFQSVHQPIELIRIDNAAVIRRCRHVRSEPPRPLGREGGHNSVDRFGLHEQVVWRNAHLAGIRAFPQAMLDTTASATPWHPQWPGSCHPSRVSGSCACGSLDDLSAGVGASCEENVIEEKEVKWAAPLVTEDD